MWNFCDGCIHVNLRIFSFVIPGILYSIFLWKKKSFWNSKIWLLLPTLDSAWLKSDIFHPPYRTRGKIRGAGNEIFIGKPTAYFLSLEYFKKQKLGIIYLLGFQIMVSPGACRTFIFRRPWRTFVTFFRVVSNRLYCR